MKPLLTGIAIFIIISIMLVFQIDNYNCRLQTEFLKYCADEAANAASLMVEETKYIDGYKIYNKEEGIRTIENTIKNYLKTDNNLMPLANSYWKEKINYTAYFFDDDMICDVYKNGIKTNTFNFIYPYMYTDEELEYKKIIEKSNVIVTINAGISTYRLAFIKEPIIIRSSGYEYDI